MGFGVDSSGKLLDSSVILAMPTYEYECQKCGVHFDYFQSIKDKPKRTCPKCRGRVKRLLGTGAGLLFKGSGFYITDYRKPGYREAASKESGAVTTASSSKNSTPVAPSTASKASKNRNKD